MIENSDNAKSSSNEINGSVSNYNSMESSRDRMTIDDPNQNNNPNRNIENKAPSDTNFSKIENDFMDNSTMPLSKCSCCAEDDINSPEYNVDDTQSLIFSSQDQPSNETLLHTALISFLLFTCVQAFAAVYAHSASMLADSSAMSVDVFTYAFNLFAEKEKKTVNRKRQLELELIPPLISVVTLLFITVVVMKGAIQSILQGYDKSISTEDEPNVNLMFIFSLINLFLDILNVGCFAKAKHALGFSTTNRNLQESNALRIDYSDIIFAKELENGFKDNYFNVESVDKFEFMPKSNAENRPMKILKNKNDYDEYGSIYKAQTSGSQKGSFLKKNYNKRLDTDEKDDIVNLNMCSAYTHVFADTLRSIAVLVSSALAKIFDNISGEQADDVAAMIVSIIIFISVIPLLHGITLTLADLQAFKKEEAMKEEGETQNEIL